MTLFSTRRLDRALATSFSRPGFTLVILLLAFAGFAHADTLPSGKPGLRVIGTEFHLTQEDGTVLTSRDLIGRVLSLGAAAEAPEMKIVSVENDPRDGTGRVLLHTFAMRQPGGEWYNPCLPDPDGKQLAFPLTGYWTDNETHVDDHSRFTLTCTNGARGKCVRFGYHFWAKGPHGEDLHPYYQACTRMVIADYCGTGRATTRNGMLIDIYDKLGIQVEEPTTRNLAFEAAWTPEGAVCVHHARVPENLDLKKLPEQCPRLAQSPTGDACTESWAKRQKGVLLFNRSATTPVTPAR